MRFNVVLDYFVIYRSVVILIRWHILFTKHEWPSYCVVRVNAVVCGLLEWNRICAKFYCNFFVLPLEVQHYKWKGWDPIIRFKPPPPQHTHTLFVSARSHFQFRMSWSQWHNVRGKIQLFLLMISVNSLLPLLSHSTIVMDRPFNFREKTSISTVDNLMFTFYEVNNCFSIPKLL